MKNKCLNKSIAVYCIILNNEKLWKKYNQKLVPDNLYLLFLLYSWELYQFYSSKLQGKCGLHFMQAFYIGMIFLSHRWTFQIVFDQKLSFLDQTKYSYLTSLQWFIFFFFTVWTCNILFQYNVCSHLEILKKPNIDLHITYMWIHLTVNICFKSAPT